MTNKITENELNSLTKKELVDYIKNTFHSEIIKLFSEIEKLYNKINKNSTNDNYFLLLEELIKQFKFELNEHIKREHEKYFDFLLKVEEEGIYDLDLFNTIIKVETTEHSELETYINGIIKVLNKLNQKNSNDYNLIITKINTFYALILKTIKYENHLIEKVRIEMSNVMVNDI